MSFDIRLDALQYHSQPRPGKVETLPCKPCFSQRDLTLAYSPGVAEPCLRIQEDPSQSALYTCLLYTSPSPRDPKTSRMPSSA